MEIFTDLDLEGISTDHLPSLENGDDALSKQREIECFRAYRSQVVADMRDAWDDMDWERVELLDGLYDELSRMIETLTDASCRDPLPNCLSGS